MDHVSSLFNSILKKLDIPVRKTYLFGSRATGDENPNSDYDFLVMLDMDMSHSERRKIASQVRLELYKIKDIPSIDFILRSPSDFGNYQDSLNSLDYEVYHTGIAL